MGRIITLIGDDSTGKTNLAKTIETGEYPNEGTPTVGASFSVFKNLKIWDTAGKEMYKEMAPLYCKEAFAILFVFDVTKESTFNGIDSWFKLIQSNVDLSEKKIFIIGTKMDLVKEISAELDNKAKEYAKTHNAEYFLVSARNQINIYELVLRLCTMPGPDPLDPKLLKKKHIEKKKEEIPTDKCYI